MSKFRTIAVGLACLLSVALIAEAAFAQKTISREEVVKRMENSQKYFTETVSNPATMIPKVIMEKASGIVIVRQLKMGFIVGTSGGGGFAMMKDMESGNWTAPAFVQTGEMSFGLQIGATSANAIYVVMTPDSMKKILKGKVKIGVDVSAQVGPVGKEATVDLEKAPEVFIYSKNKGLYGGAAFKVASLREDKAANEVFYGKQVSLDDILFNNAVEIPAEANEFVEFLKAY